MHSKVHSRFLEEMTTRKKYRAYLWFGYDVFDVVVKTEVDHIEYAMSKQGGR